MDAHDTRYTPSGLEPSGSAAASISSRPNYHANLRSDVIPHVPIAAGTLVDIGGGSGVTAAELKRLGRATRVGVIDIVAIPGGVAGVDFSYIGDLEKPSFLGSVVANEGPFTTILCLDILEHLVDPWRVIAELHKALARGGVIVASIPNVRNYQVLLPLVFRNRWTLRDDGILDRTHLRFFVKQSAIDLMCHSGLKLELAVSSEHHRRAVRIFRVITLGLFNSFTDRQYIIRVRRDD